MTQGIPTTKVFTGMKIPSQHHNQTAFATTAFMVEQNWPMKSSGFVPPQVKETNPSMFEIKPERFEAIPTDYALAYSALARRVAAIDAILRSGQWDEHCLKKVRAEADAAMTTIQQVETVRFTISPQ
jgi:hypothetical protein